MSIRRRWLYILIAFLIAYFMAHQIRSQGKVPSELAERADLYDVEIMRDEWGVPHILGETDADAAFGLAYAHAEDDFTTIQGSLVAARGRLASMLGSEGGPNDYMVALLRVEQITEEGYAAMDSATKALCDAYADGLNVYAAQHADEALRGIWPMTGRDVVAGFVHKTPLFFGLERVLATLFEEADLGADPPDSTEATGSNAFAVAPSRTADGRTYLAVNSHQPWTGPVAWYEAHLMSREGLNMLGGTFPGSPVILHGHNQHLGWAHTVNNPDVVDLYTLTVHPENPDLYLQDGEWVPFLKEQANIPVRLVGMLEWTFDRDLTWSAHGPVVRSDTGAVAVRFSGWGDAGQVAQWYAMNRATTMEEWQAAMSRQAIPVFNTVYADREGQIQYLYNARIPIREPGFDWSGRARGDSSVAIWQEYLPFEDLPRVVNPEVGFVQNANSTPFLATGTEADPSVLDFPTSAGIETHQTNRAMRALELFSADTDVTWEEFKAYKYDMRYAVESRAARLVRQLRFASPGDSLAREAVAVLAGWDLGTDPDNREAALAVGTLRPFLDQYGEAISTTALMTRLRETAAWLLEHHGTLTPTWAEVNRLRRGDVDLGLGGAPDVLHAVYGNRSEDGRLVGFQGDSYVLLAAFDQDGPVRSESINVFGSAISRPESPHYADQAELFVQRQLKETPFTEEEVRAAAVRTYRPGRDR
ncbi:MAG: acylase [Rhodothermales bacterium]|nr:acylase [Rhodothermales bacterium]MBO6778758.1 acylase [Rhodothermales bacterium]